jgi:hypothetical protein
MNIGNYACHEVNKSHLYWVLLGIRKKKVRHSEFFKIGVIFTFLFSVFTTIAIWAKSSFVSILLYSEAKYSA